MQYDLLGSDELSHNRQDDHMVRFYSKIFTMSADILYCHGLLKNSLKMRKVIEFFFAIKYGPENISKYSFFANDGKFI